MNIMITILLLMAIVFIVYERYMPIFGLDCMELDQMKKLDKVILLDVRDYPSAYKTEIPGAINIPVVYLKRNYVELKGETIYIVASGKTDVNMSTRFLRKKGFKIKGYNLKQESNPSSRKLICRSRRGIHGIQ